MKKSLLIFLLSILGIGIVFAVAQFIKTGNNWDANVTGGSANDIFILNGRLDLEDSRTNDYINNNYRGKITGTINSELFGDFNIENKLELKYKEDYNSSYDCGGETPIEIYNISGTIKSDYWGEMQIESNSYFCSNQYLKLNFNSDTLGNKDIGNSTQTPVEDVFGKQEISISGIVRVNGDLEDGVLNRGDGKFNNIGISLPSKTLTNKYINKNISKIFKEANIETNNLNLTNANVFNNTTGKEKFYLYNLNSSTRNINFKTTDDYINKGDYIKIGNNGENIIKVKGLNTVIVKSGNIYINSNLTYLNDSGKDNNKNLLILIAKKDKNTKKGGNIYINPDVTNIDAILIADGSLISLSGNNIQKVTDTGNPSTIQINNIRKQLLIHGSVLSSNVVGTDKIPYGADYYEVDINNDGIYDYQPNKDNIYDLGNIRTFNLNYGDGILDDTKLVPIADNNGNYKENAWVGQCKWYNGEDCTINLRKSEKLNPLIIEYDNKVQFLNPKIFKK